MSTPSMTLFHNPASPFVRKVRVLLHETGQLDRVTLHACVPTPVKPDADVILDNALGKIPALRLADGNALHDSRVILDYLDYQHTGTPLIPRNGPARWRRLTLASTADGIMDAAVLVRYETAMRPEENIGTCGWKASATRSAAPSTCSNRTPSPNWPGRLTWPRSAWRVHWLTWTSATRTCSGGRAIRSWRRGMPR